ncbi:MAG TPA: HlyD family efflux transporter periplasmic adaptor subunit [Pirellulales bacterium]
MTAVTAEDRGVANRLQNGFAHRSHRRKGAGWVRWLLSFVGALGGLGLLYLAYSRVYSGDDVEVGRFLTTTVKRGDLLITVTEDGNVESAHNVELKSKVPGSNTILDIIPDGSHVKEGDQLVKLDSWTIEEQITTQEIAVAKAEAARITSSKNYAAAKIAVEEYDKGTFVQERQQFEADITVAKQNLSSAENLLYYSQKMHRKGYVTQLDVESKQFAVEQAKLNLAVAERKKEVLEKYTKAKMLEDLTSKRDSAEALMKSDEAAYKKETQTLDRLQTQLKECTIFAPQDGMVVYANDMSGSRRGDSGPKIDLGAQVNQFQAILRLPDLKNMQVKTLVHETKVDSLRIGMRARVKIQDREFQGEITSIANQAEPGNWFSSGVKEYSTVVKIDGEPQGLKPGMTAEVEILVTEQKGALEIPVQCVVEGGGKFHAWVKTNKGIERRNLVLGGTNDSVIAIVDGLKEGEKVLQNPRADVPTATDEIQDEEAVDVNKRFGSIRAPAPGQSPGGPPATGPGAGKGGNEGALGGGPDAVGAGRSGRGGRGGRGGGGPEGGGQGGNRRPRTFKESDKNGDGKITMDELPERAQQFFSMMDTNGDGGVDPAEHKAAEERRKQMMQQGGGPGGGPPGGGQ